MNYIDYLEKLNEVPPFRPLALKKQAVSRLPGWVHPIANLFLIQPASHIMRAMDQKKYKTFEVEGKSNIPPHPKEPLIFIANHQSYLDAPVVGAQIAQSFGKPPWFMAKKRLWDRLNYRLSFSLLGALPYTRRSVDFATHLHSLKSFISLLKAGEAIVIFPEGTIPGEVELGSKGFCRLRSQVEAETGLLKSGPLVPLLALITGAKVIPVGHSGLGQVLPPEIHPGKIWKKRSTKNYNVKVQFGEPIDVRQKLSLHDQNSFDETALTNYTQSELMPTLSRLIDFSMHEVPINVPLAAADYERVKTFEARVIEEYRNAGLNGHAEKLIRSKDV